MADKLPNPLPGREDTPVQLLAWASKATLQKIVATWRPGHSEHAGLLVRLESGREIFFESVSDATSPKRFFAAFIAVGGFSMAAYSEAEVRIIVSALVRAAQLSHEADERDFWEDTGATFLRACLTLGNTETIALDVETDAGRRARYGVAARYAAEQGRRSDDQMPGVLVAVDTEQLLVPRGPFLSFANRRRRGVSPGTVNAQMQRLGWELLELRPRKPKAPVDYPRPHARLWAIPNGWDGLGVEIKAGKVIAIDDESGPVVPPGPMEYARENAPRPRAGTRRDHGTKPQDQGTGS